MSHNFITISYLVINVSIITGCRNRPASINKSMAEKATSYDVSTEVDEKYEKIPSPFERRGVRPDCSEKRFTYDALIKLANASPTRQVFLEKIPRDVMQTYTYVRSGESPQAESINDTYPGVIRMNANGTLVMRYTCQPKKAYINQVEVIRFTEKGFEFSELKFDPNAQRIEENPESCAECHARTKSSKIGRRPNWHQYDTWPGIFGSEDDAYLFEGSMTFQVDPIEEAAFQKFKKSEQYNDPCYSNLPRPSDDLSTMFPYGTSTRNKIYALRPNLRLTETFSHLLALRNFRSLRSFPEYRSIRPALTFEAARCQEVLKFDESRLDAYLSKKLPKYKDLTIQGDFDIPTFRGGSPTPQFHPQLKQSLAVKLYSASIALGFIPGDWTLNFNDWDNPAYNSGISFATIPQVTNPWRTDVPISALTQGHIVLDFLTDYENDPSLKTKVLLSRGESSAFGAEFGCIDDVGGVPYFISSDAHLSVCNAVVAAMNDQN